MFKNCMFCVVCDLQELQEELRHRQDQQASLQALWSHLQPEDDGGEESDEAQEKLHVTGSKLKLLLRQVDRDVRTLQQRLVKVHNLFPPHVRNFPEMVNLVNDRSGMLENKYLSLIQEFESASAVQDSGASANSKKASSPQRYVERHHYSACC